MLYIIGLITQLLLCLLAEHYICKVLSLLERILLCEQTCRMVTGTWERTFQAGELGGRRQGGE